MDFVEQIGVGLSRFDPRAKHEFLSYNHTPKSCICTCPAPQTLSSKGVHSLDNYESFHGLHSLKPSLGSNLKQILAVLGRALYVSTGPWDCLASTCSDALLQDVLDMASLAGLHCTAALRTLS